MTTTTTPNADMAAILRRAADIIEQDGWCQGQYINEDGCHCMAGAIARAIEPSVDLTAKALAFTEGKGLGDIYRDVDAWVWEETIWKEYVERKRPHCADGIAVWNDTPNRTAEEVIAKLRSVADKLETENPSLND